MTRHTTLTQRMVRAWLAFALVAAAGVYGLVTARPAEAAQRVTVGLTSMSPTVVTSDSGELTLTGNLMVPAGQTHDDVIIQLAYAPMRYRSDLGNGPGTGDVHQLTSLEDQDHLGTISAGEHPWTLRPSIQSLGLSPDHVYALDVEAWTGGELLATLRTYLPYEIGSGQSLATTQLTVLAPVTAAAPLDGYQEPVSGGRYPELTADALAQEMRTDGSLYQLLSAGAQLPAGTISWVVDPDLLNAAGQIQDGYVVSTSGSAGEEVGPAANDAGAWLKEAGTVLSSTNSELWQLPATDPDLGSLSRAPSAQARSLLAAAQQQTASGAAVKNATGHDPRGLIAWPAGGQVDSATLALAQSLDPAAVVVDSDSIGLSVADQSYTPTGRASAGGAKNLVVADDSLDTVMDGDPADAVYSAAAPDATVLAGQRLLAQTALLALEKPTLGRSVMLTLPRSAAAAASDMAVLGVLKNASWLRPVGLSTLLRQSPDVDATTDPSGRAAEVADSDLSGAQLSEVTSLDGRLALYQSILTSATDPASAGFATAVLRTVSTAWRGQTGSWAAYEATVADRLKSQMGEVYLIPKSNLTLSGTTGYIPFTVVNHLPQPVVLGLQIATSRSGLRITGIQPRKFTPGTTTVEVKVDAVAPGANIKVTAYLVNAAQQPYGDAESGGTRSLLVSVTSIGFVALLLFAASAALLVIAVGLRIYRGRKASRREPETQAGD